MTREILEKSIVAKIVRHLPRRPVVNCPTEAELFDLGSTDGLLLAVASDSICEEIAAGLYTEPFLIGWMAVMSPVSDLAAAGARILGVSLLMNLTKSLDPAECEELGRGTGDACRSLHAVTLGGDTSISDVLTVGACAIGLVPRDGVITRCGAKAGDAVYLTGPAGLGSAYALSRVDPRRTPQRLEFRPRPPIELGELIARHASCTIDTSDGVIAALDELARVNGVGFDVTVTPEELLHVRASQECRCRGLPPWLALAGCHGEFEVLFTVASQRNEKFLDAARDHGFEPLHLGRVVARHGVALAWDGTVSVLDSVWLRNRAASAIEDTRQYFDDLVDYARKVGR